MANDIGALADTLKALGDPNRLRLLQVLSRQKTRKDIGVCELAKQLGISQPNVSHHLKILKLAGFIQCEKRENYAYYIPNPEKIDEITSTIRSEILMPAPARELS